MSTMWFKNGDCLEHTFQNTDDSYLKHFFRCVILHVTNARHCYLLFVELSFFKNVYLIFFMSFLKGSVGNLKKVPKSRDHPLFSICKKAPFLFFIFFLHICIIKAVFNFYFFKPVLTMLLSHGRDSYMGNMWSTDPSLPPVDTLNRSDDYPLLLFVVG